MKFGYFTLTDNPPAYGPNRRDPNRFLLEVVEECVEAEAMGYHSAWVPEHHFGRFGILPSPTMFLAHIANRTKRLKLGPATVVLPINHPLRMVEEFNLLDLLSGGRAVFSAGRGYDQGEYTPFGASFADSRAVFDEQMEYMMTAWRQSPFEFHGRYYSTPEPLTVLPRPVQHPHPEVYVACFSKPSIELAARLRVNTIFAPFAAAMLFGSVQDAARESKRMARDAGHPDPKVMCSYFVSVSHTAEETDRARVRLLHYLHSILPVFPSDRRTAPPHIAYFVDIVERLKAMKADQVSDRSIVTGDVEHCIEVLKRCEEGGISEVILYFNFGELNHRDTLKSMERFAREVMPHFAERSTTIPRRPMKFGLNFFPSFRPSDYSTAEYFAQCLRLAERADRLGFHSVKAVEHYFYDYGGHSPNPVVFLAAVAARTQRIRPITGAVIPAFNNPVKLAAELAVLDNLSNGRLDVGFGRAFIPKEFEVFGVSMDESRARFEEGVDIVKRLWTEDRVSYDGKFHRFRDVHLNPRPVQKPHPPIWVATVASIESFVWAGRHGYNVMIVPYVGGIEKVRGMVQAYRQAWREAGHPPGKEQVQTSLHCYVAETHAKAIEGARPRVERYIEVFGEAVGSWASHQAAQYASYGKMVESIARTTLESMLEGHQALIGTPEEVVEQLAYQIQVFGEIEPSMQINFGGSSGDEALRTLELFAGRVMPRFST